MEIFESSGLNTPRARPRKHRRAAAFSLVEIALALGIMAFALVSVFGLMPLGLTSFKKAMDTSVGSQIAQQITVEAQQSDFDTLVGTQAASFARPVRYFDDQGTEGVKGQAGMVYQANTRIVPSTAMPGSSSTVTVQVADNPYNLPMASDVNHLWTSSTTTPVTTFSSYVARNSSSPAPAQ